MQGADITVATMVIMDSEATSVGTDMVGTEEIIAEDIIPTQDSVIRTTVDTTEIHELESALEITAVDTVEGIEVDTVAVGIKKAIPNVSEPLR